MGLAVAADPGQVAIPKASHSPQQVLMMVKRLRLKVALYLGTDHECGHSPSTPMRNGGTAALTPTGSFPQGAMVSANQQGVSLSEAFRSSRNDGSRLTIKGALIGNADAESNEQESQVGSHGAAVHQ